MKKSSLFLVSAAAMLFLAACGPKPSGGESSEPAATSQAHKHTYGEWTETKAPTCTEKGSKERTCTECGEKQTQSVSAKGHTYVEDASKSKAATCLEGGTKVSKCSVCGDEKTEEVDALGHDNVKAEDQTGAVAPTCEDAGTEIQECSRCHEKTTVDVEATGHTWGEDTWTKVATCTEAAEGTHKCETCNKEEAISEPALGHDIQLIGDDSEPEEGKAKVRVYSCANECGTTYLGFKANEVTAESKEHLTIGEDGGASFWGRPIGNNLELDESGTSVNQKVGELVFDETQTGDFFEYKFDLTAEQAASLSNCQLYCDAKPSNYMGANGVDFWAYGADSSDWTPGAYIEGDKKGEIITDYRYVLYVDGVRKDFDSTMTTPVSRGDPRGEYVMPYTFKLHEGENSIRLVMAGGYRSTFYNFTFRAVEEKPVDPGTDPVDPPAATSYTLNVTDASGYNNPKEKCKSTATWDPTTIPAGTYNVSYKAKCTSTDHTDRKWYNMATAGEETRASNPDTTEQDPFRYFIKVADTTYNPTSTKSWGEEGLNTTDYNVAENVITNVVVPTDGAKIELCHGNIGFSLYFDSIIFTPVK